MTQIESLKAAAAERALELVRPGMVIGLGSGSTSALFIAGLGRLVSRGIAVRGVPTSRAAADQAAAAGIPLQDHVDRPLDLAVDGADEIDPQRNLIKGRGGAMLREKLVAAAAQRFIVIADESKLVPRLGQGALPVEISSFLWLQTARRLERLATRWVLRGGDDHPFVTDNGNFVIDLSVEGGIAEPARLASALDATLGVMAHGLFLGMATACIIAGPSGCRVLGSLE
ncbi:MAG TPA: ribose-5-phosphate isomerase RpiA [Candidatus Limnocylindria bacterium]|nr:ribose-5-phosphate isomerase RpiA [Candidatus Limnocylindria bacterium]